MTVQLLTYISQRFADPSTFSSGNGTSLPTFPPVASSATRVNAFWFCGLVMSLSTASFGIFTKQWLREYLIHESSPERHLRIRFFRAEGLEEWHVLEIVSALPFLLQFSVLLFFLGLGEFLINLSSTIGTIVVTLMSLWVFLVVMITMAPSVSAKCPWKTPLLHRPLRRIRIRLYPLRSKVALWRRKFNRLSPILRLSSIITRFKCNVLHSYKVVITQCRNALHWCWSLLKPKKEGKSDWVWPLIKYPDLDFPEEDIISMDNELDVHLLVVSYGLAQNDEFLINIITTLTGERFSLERIMFCLGSIYKIRSGDVIDQDQPIGSPSDYSNPVLAALFPLLVDRVRGRAERRYKADSLTATVLDFLLVPGNEDICPDIWSCVGYLLQCDSYAPLILRYIIKHRDVTLTLPKFPQFNGPNKKGMLPVAKFSYFWG